MKGFEAVSIVLGSQVMAPGLFLDWPNTQKVTNVKSTRHPRGLSKSYWGWSALSVEEEFPARLIITGEYVNGGNWSLGIDLEEQVIVHADWSKLTGDSYIGSAALGISLIGLPALILASPLLLLAHGSYAVVNAVTGMDRHTWGVWRQIKAHLNSDDRDVVHLAFLNHCNGVEKAYIDRLRAAHDAQVRQERIAMQFVNRKDDICEGAFMVRYMAGCAEPDEIIDDIADWHHRQGADVSVQLPEWLGLTRQEYEDWSTQKKTVFDIEEDRRMQA